MPASVYSRVARKRKFSTLSLRSAVENGSFSRQCFSLKNELQQFLSQKKVREEKFAFGPTKKFNGNCESISRQLGVFEIWIPIGPFDDFSISLHFRFYCFFFSASKEQTFCTIFIFVDHDGCLSASVLLSSHQFVSNLQVSADLLHSSCLFFTGVSWQHRWHQCGDVLCRRLQRIRDNSFRSNRASHMETPCLPQNRILRMLLRSLVYQYTHLSEFSRTTIAMSVACFFLLALLLILFQASVGLFSNFMIFVNSCISTFSSYYFFVLSIQARHLFHL